MRHAQQMTFEVNYPSFVLEGENGILIQPNIHNRNLRTFTPSPCFCSASIFEWNSDI